MFFAGHAKQGGSQSLAILALSGAFQNHSHFKAPQHERCTAGTGPAPVPSSPGLFDWPSPQLRRARRRPRSNKFRVTSQVRWGCRMPDWGPHCPTVNPPSGPRLSDQSGGKEAVRPTRELKEKGNGGKKEKEKKAFPSVG